MQNFDYYDFWKSTRCFLITIIHLYKLLVTYDTHSVNKAKKYVEKKIASAPVYKTSENFQLFHGINIEINNINSLKR